MNTPALNIPVRATGLDDFKKQMNETSAIAGTALRVVTSQVIKMNAGFLASQGAAGVATLAFGRILGILGPIALGITAVSDAFKLMGYATDLAKQKISEWNDIADKANKSGFSTDFFQRITKSSGNATESVDQLTEALTRFNEASTPKLGGSDLQKRLDELTGAENFKGNTGIGKLGLANDSEQRLRAIVDLINQAMQKGERLAAIDLANAAFGPKVAAALQADSGYLNQMIQRADIMSKANLISPEDIGRAIELKDRMQSAQEVLASKWKPVQDDLATLGMNYHESWVGITEVLASAVGYATDLYKALHQVPDWFAKNIGNASVWSSLTDFTGKLGLNSDPASLGIITDPAEIAKTQGTDRLRTALQNHGNVTRGMQEATSIQSAVRGDTSKDPTTKQAAQDQNDAVDRAINSLRKHTEQQEADTRAVGLGDAALAKFRAQADETSAVQANGGKETAEQAAQFKVLQEKAGAAADALAKARLNSEIAFSNKTAFLSPEDVQIATQLRGIYGDDVPKALNSSEAAALRLNNALKGTADAFSNSINGPLLEFESGTKNAGSAMKDFETQFIRSLLNMLNQALIVKPLLSGIGGLLGLGGGSSLAGATMSSGLGAGTGGLPFPMFAGGTDSAPGGLAWVGERGPELVNLPKGSQVIPNHVSTRIMDGIPKFADGGVIGGGSAAPIFGNQTHIAPTVNVTVQGSPGMTAADHERMGQTIGKQIQPAIQQIVAKELRTQRRPGGILR